MQYPTIANGIDFRELVFLSGSDSLTDTFKVALAFGKDHKEVLRKTRTVIKSCSPSFAERNFTLCHENNELQNGKPQPFYRMTKDGWTMLVFSFTGKTAIAFKEAYIAAFNWMANRLNQLQMLGEQAQHEYVIKERVSKCKATIGSQLMHRRRKEIPLLRNELERVKSLTTPDLFCVLLQ